MAFVAIVVLTALADWADAADRPNIVVIMTDDQVETDVQYMPTTRALLEAGGTTFKFSYASYPLCCPSRTTFLTGKYAHNHRILDNYTDERSGWAKTNHSNT